MIGSKRCLVKGFTIFLVLLLVVTPFLFDLHRGEVPLKEDHVPNEKPNEKSLFTFNNDGDNESPLSQTPLWNYSLDVPDVEPSDSSIVISPKGSIYVLYWHYRDTYLISVDENGNELWTRTFDNKWIYDLTFGENEKVYFTALSETDLESYLYSIDSNGNVIWENTFEDLRISKELVLYENSIYFTSQDGELHKYNLEGSLVFNSTIGEKPSGPLVGSDGNIYAISKEPTHTLIALDSNGEEKWRKTIIQSPNWNLKDFLLNEDNIYVFGWNETDRSVDIFAYENDGTLRFEANLKNRLIMDDNIVVDQSGYIYIVVSDIKEVHQELSWSLIAINNDGDIIWEKILDPDLLKAPTGLVCVNDVLYVGYKNINQRGRRIENFSVFTKDGEHMLNLHAEDIRYLTMPSSGPEGRLYIISDERILYAFEKDKTEEDNEFLSGYIIPVVMIIGIVLIIFVIYNKYRKDI